jgi:hypothetical protein
MPSNKLTIEQLIAASTQMRGQRPWHLADADLTKVAQAKAAGKPIPSLRVLSDFLFTKTGVRFSKTSIGERIQRLQDQFPTKERKK